MANVITVLGDGRFWAALLTFLFGVFMSSQSGRQIVAAAVDQVVTALEKRNPSWQKSQLQQLATEGVQLAFQVLGLSAPNDQKQAMAAQYIQDQAAKLGIKIDPAQATQLVDLIWGAVRGQVFTTHAAALQAKAAVAHYAQPVDVSDAPTTVQAAVAPAPAPAAKAPRARKAAAPAADDALVAAAPAEPAAPEAASMRPAGPNGAKQG